MQLDVVSQLPESRGRALRKYRLDDIDTVGAFGNEPFAVRFTNTSSQKVQVRLSLDGTDVLTGKLADLDAHSRMWVIRPYGTMELKAWPESHQGGAQFVFTQVESSVALHTHGDLTAKGYISAAVFVEGWTPPRITYRGFDDDLEVSRSYGGGTRSLGISKGGPAIGAGGYTQQRVDSAQGLIQPTFSEIIQVRYIWWDDLVALLQEKGVQPTQQHPTGFHGDKLADLGTTPRIGETPSASMTTGYQRFM